MKNLNQIFSKKHCIIEYSWLIVTFIVISLLISACNSPSSVRSQYRKSKEKSVDNKKHYYLEEEKEASTNITQDVQVNPSENDIASNDIQSGSSPKIKIPSLREQMRIYTEEQNIIKEKIINIENDIVGIKTTLTEIKENITPNKLDNAIAGDYYLNNHQNIPSNNTETRKQQILSDEKVNTKNETKPNVKKIQNQKSANKIAEKQAKTQNKSVNKIQKSEPIKNDENTKKQSAPESLNGTIESAMNLMKQRKYESAIVEFNQIALSTKSNQVITTCNYWIGESYFAQNQYDKAAQSFQRVIKSTSNFKKDNAQMLLAECYSRIGKLDNAKLACQTLIDNYPKSIFVPKAKKLLQTL